MGLSWKDLGWLGGPVGAALTGAIHPFSSGNGNKTQRSGLIDNANNAAGFAGQAQAGYGLGSSNIAGDRNMLLGQAQGQNSVSAEQLRQALQQNQAAQMSMAAGASPQNAAMAARTAAIQSGRLGAGLAGQQALAGLQERQQAMQALAQLDLGARGQDLQGTLGGYGAVNQAYTGAMDPNGDKSWFEKNAGALSGLASAAGMAAKSDRRAKTDIADGDAKARNLLDGLKAYSYKYKDKKDGEGEQFGVMAQDLEKSGLKSAVIDTPNGKMVHGARLALALAGASANLNARIKKLEGDED